MRRPYPGDCWRHDGQRPCSVWRLPIRFTVGTGGMSGKSSASRHSESSLRKRPSSVIHPLRGGCQLPPGEAQGSLARAEDQGRPERSFGLGQMGMIQFIVTPFNSPS